MKQVKLHEILSNTKKKTKKQRTKKNTQRNKTTKTTYQKSKLPRNTNKHVKTKTHLFPFADQSRSKKSTKSTTNKLKNNSKNIYFILIPGQTPPKKIKIKKNSLQRPPTNHQNISREEPNHLNIFFFRRSTSFFSTTPTPLRRLGARLRRVGRGQRGQTPQATSDGGEAAAGGGHPGGALERPLTFFFVCGGVY